MRTHERVLRRYRLMLAMSLDEASKLLGVSPSASREEVSKAYKRKVLETHPDRGGDHDKMVELNAAKDILDGKTAPAYDSGSTYGGPGTPYDPGPRPDPTEEVTSFADALSGANLPSGIEWVFKTDVGRGQYLDQQDAACVVYGKTDSAHVFVGLHHRAADNAFTRHKIDVWTVTSAVHPLSKSIEDVAPSAIRVLWSGFGAAVKGYNAKVQLLPSGTKLSEKLMFSHGRSISFKDAMGQLVGDGSKWKDRKLSVVMELRSKRDGEEFKNGMAFVINGREYPLSDDSVELIEKRSKVLPVNFGTYYYFDGSKKDLTRAKKGKLALKWFSDRLVSESQELRDLLGQASEQMAG